MKSIAQGSLKDHYVVIFVSIFVSVFVMILMRANASAATINVVAGTDAINDNNQCQLSEAIININDQAQTHDDCPAGDGNNDTINLPSGTITLSVNLPDIRSQGSVTIIGQGPSQTIIDCDNGEYNGIAFFSEETNSRFSAQQFKIRASGEYGVAAYGGENVTLSNIEIDNTGVVVKTAVGIQIVGTANVSISDVYINGLTSDEESAIGISVQYGYELPVGNVTIDNATISNLFGTTEVMGIIVFVKHEVNPIPASIIATINNSTISGFSASEQAETITPILIAATVQASSSNITVTMNNTAIDVQNTSQGPLAGGIAVGGAAYDSEDSNNVTVNTRNTLLTYKGQACRIIGDFGALFENEPSAGNLNLNINSLGGNISDDNSCNDYFTQSTDKNNITNLSDYLGDIANNGGTIPTMALLPGNPAIDGGVCGEGVPSTDARGIARPQGKTCDSGAYEVEQATPSGTISDDKAVALNVPAGVVVNEFGTVAGSIPSDNQGDAEYEFPLGLLSFELGVPQGSTNEISLDFESDLDPESVVARKYNPSDQTFTTLTNATITKITKDNKPTLRLTYAIKDGEFPDLDNQANGTITDPIGLATEKKGVLANTGLAGLIVAPFGILLTSLAIATYVDYRKHKKPLMDADPFNASTYTYWHHLRTVTIPLFSYRLSVGFERKQSTRAITN